MKDIIGEVLKSKQDNKKLFHNLSYEVFEKQKIKKMHSVVSQDNLRPGEYDIHTKNEAKSVSVNTEHNCCCYYKY